MATEINMVEGDTAPDRTFTITRGGTAVSLVGATSVKVILVDTGTGLVTNTGHQTTTINSPASAGSITYAFADGDIASANVHFGDIVVLWNTGQIETDFDRLIIHVRPKVTTVS